MTEWGHYLALVTLLVFLPGWSRAWPGRVAAALGAAAILLFLSPLIRARPLAGAVAMVFRNVQPRSATGAPALASPLSAAGLFTKPAAPEVNIETITYAERGGRPLELDVYRRLGARAPEPLVVIIHGGSWSAGTRTDLAELNNYLAARGYVVASPSYRLAPAHPHPAQWEDIGAAIDFLKTSSLRFGADSTRIALIGRSAGGQLALMSAYARNDPAVRGVVSFYAPTDQTWGWENPANPRVLDTFATLRSFLSGSPAENPEGYRTSSPLLFAPRSSVPTLIIHGSRDELVSVKQAARLDSVLSLNRRPHLFLEMSWATHGCDYVFNGPCGQITTYAIERFLASVL